MVVIEPTRQRRQGLRRIDRRRSLAPDECLAAFYGDDDQPQLVGAEDSRAGIAEDAEDAVVRMAVFVVGSHGDEAGSRMNAPVQLGALVA
jgi:hypothetical protein